MVGSSTKGSYRTFQDRIITVNYAVQVPFTGMIINIGKAFIFIHDALTCGEILSGNEGEKTQHVRNLGDAFMTGINDRTEIILINLFQQVYFTDIL